MENKLEQFMLESKNEPINIINENDEQKHNETDKINLNKSDKLAPSYEASSKNY